MLKQTKIALTSIAVFAFKRMQWALVLFSFAVTASSLPSTAGAMTVTAGSNVNGDCTFGCRASMQQLYSSSLFGSSLVNVNSVSTFSFLGNAVGGTWDMYLSTSGSTVGTMSSTFADNRGSDYSYFGSLGPLTGLSDLDLVTFSGSFAYDPTMGDLLVEWVGTSNSQGGAMWASSGSGNISRLISTAVGATVGGNEQNYGITTQFEFSTVSEVPLPAAFPLLAGGLGLMGLLGWRRKRKVTVA